MPSKRKRSDSDSADDIYYKDLEEKIRKVISDIKACEDSMMDVSQHIANTMGKFVRIGQHGHELKMKLFQSVIALDCAREEADEKMMLAQERVEREERRMSRRFGVYKRLCS